jgi:phosphoglycerate dehydrogenase-like enzyme
MIVSGRTTPPILIFHPQAERYRELLGERDPEASAVAVTDEAAFRRALPQAEILVAQRFPAEILLEPHCLRWVQVTAAGVEFLAPVAGRTGDLLVTNARGVHRAIIADYAFAAMLALQWDLPGLQRDQAARRWKPRRTRALDGRTVGIVGLGAIGQEIARRAVAFGMEVLAVRRSSVADVNVEMVFPPDALHECLARSDFVVLAVPATGETGLLMDRAAIAAMKPGAFLVNVARGSVVDEPALAEALAEGRLAGACLDVFAEEPLPPESPLWTFSNVIVTPHMAGAAADYEERFTDIFVDNLGRYARGEPLRNLVDLARGY